MLLGCLAVRRLAANILSGLRPLMIIYEPHQLAPPSFCLICGSLVFWTWSSISKADYWLSFGLIAREK